jgi:Nucleotidyl transferase AbiEii toxin, Type IV TA system
MQLAAVEVIAHRFDRLVVVECWTTSNQVKVSHSFSPRLEILSPPQRRLWNELREIPPEFVLYGGTAIALYLGHRQSADFDFFGDRNLDSNSVTLAIPFLEGAKVTQREPNTLSCVVDRGGPVQVSFFGLPDIPRLRTPSVSPDNGLGIASMHDLAGMKAYVVQMRAEAKDYIDIDAILVDGRIDLPAALASARAIYGAEFNPQVTLKALSYFDDGDLSRLPLEVRNRLARAVDAVDLDQLPVVTACRGDRN